MMISYRGNRDLVVHESIHDLFIADSWPMIVVGRRRMKMQVPPPPEGASLVMSCVRVCHSFTDDYDRWILRPDG